MKFYTWFFETTCKYSFSSIYIWIGAIIAYLPGWFITYLPNTYISYWLIILCLIIMTYGRILMIFSVQKLDQCESLKSITIFQQVGKYFPKTVLVTGCVFTLYIVIVELFSRKYPDFETTFLRSFLPSGDIRLLSYLIVMIFTLMIISYYEFVLAGIIVNNYKISESILAGISLFFRNGSQIISTLGLIAIIFTLYAICLTIIFPHSIINFLGVFFIIVLIEVGIIVLYLRANQEYSSTL